MNKLIAAVLAVVGLSLCVWGVARGIAGVGRVFSVDDKKGGMAAMENVDLTGAEQATFAAGCFWGVEDRFMQYPGVLATEVGYTGGHTDNPTYYAVCSDGTGHAEAVHLWFDPQKVSYRELVDLFFTLHNPTTLNRQGPDFGSQYRSAIFFHSPEQEAVARDTIAALTEAKKFRDPIVTQIVPAASFWRAEEYHQKYHLKNGGSCKY